jgi:hypothetical protein
MLGLPRVDPLGSLGLVVKFNLAITLTLLVSAQHANVYDALLILSIAEILAGSISILEESNRKED